MPLVTELYKKNQTRISRHRQRSIENRRLGQGSANTFWRDPKKYF